MKAQILADPREVDFVVGQECFHHLLRQYLRSLGWFHNHLFGVEREQALLHPASDDEVKKATAIGKLSMTDLMFMVEQILNALVDATKISPLHGSNRCPVRGADLSDSLATTEIGHTSSLRSG